MATCIHHDGALGDVLLSLPCFGVIGSGAGPPDLIGRGDIGGLLASLGVVRESCPAGSSRFAQWHAPQPEAGALDLLDRYDRMFVFTVQAGSDLVKNIRAAVPDTRVIVTIPPEGDRTHVAEFRLQQLPTELRAVIRGRPALSAALREKTGEVLAQAGDNGRGRMIIIHPGSGGKRKCWPLERYFGLAEQLAVRFAAFIMFLSGPAEAGGTDVQIRQFIGERKGMGRIAGRGLPLVAGLLAGCDLYIGNDSGVSHLAASVGAPVIALFGPTEPALWAPRGECVRVIAAETMEEISVDAVLAAAEAAVVRVIPS